MIRRCPKRIPRCVLTSSVPRLRLKNRLPRLPTADAQPVSGIDVLFARMHRLGGPRATHGSFLNRALLRLCLDR